MLTPISMVCRSNIQFKSKPPCQNDFAQVMVYMKGHIEITGASCPRYVG